MLALASSQCAILVVEDHIDTADMLTRYIRRKQFTVEAVYGGMEALEFLEKQQPQCMIVDETMPDMSGLDLLRQIKARPEYSGISVFFYSANYDWRKQMEAEALGAMGWYIKGVSSLKDLMTEVANRCGCGGAEESMS
ncbi:MAG TPA: response regulator [Tepidisphaeraceae bacterium]|jgi:CheY-like chemotaxis protein|nr:response regulator [Tepidisphaeraceae bacterium]